MALKSVVTSLDEVPEALRSEYVKTSGGTYALELEGEPAGYVKSAKLAEFRTNNRTLNAKVTELEEKLKAFDGIDPSEYDIDEAEIEDMKARLKTFEGIDPEEYRTLKAKPDAAAAVEAAKAEFAVQLASERAAHADTQFKSTVTAEFLRAGGRASAVDFMLAAAAKAFAMKDGAITTTEFSPANPGQPLTVAEWMGQQVAVSDFAFLPSTGGGAGSAHGRGPAAPAKRSVSRDPVEFGRNLAAIASGEVTVD